ncbi:MAG: D-alanyl-D-alanine carboxypeptidase/D-alanyl-D-alanine-endopeptidase [Gemmatimonadetes bacterium]|nr:D-alanyl-D-alanine carboxypeptidase/D-alanyl-D-alanine-endopeptidase [Gemmatimonadota bacterium]
MRLARRYLRSCFAVAALVVGDAMAAGAQSRETPRRSTASTRTKSAPPKKKVVPAASRGRRRPPPPPPLVPTTPWGAASLASDLNALLDQRVKTGTWGVLVTSLTRGDTLFARQADTPLMPASTQKLFTTVLAFDRLGPWHQLNTDVLRVGTLEPDGTLRGSLVLRGGGDPALAGRFLGGTPESPMAVLAQMVVNAGVKRVTGDIIADASAFEARRIPDGWLARYLNDSYAARVSALSLNANLLHVAVTPVRGRATPSITLRPALAGVKVVNQTKIRGTGRSARLSISRTKDGTVVAKGWIGGRSQARVYTVVVEDPSQFAASAFRSALIAAGINVDGVVRSDPTPDGAARVATLSSPPLTQLARVMNGESDNHFAELLLRAAARGPDGAAVGSAQLADEQLDMLLRERAGIAPHAIQIKDGSGLSSLNRVTPRALTNLLAYASRAPWSREFEQSLPIAGTSETLRSRMINTPAQGNLHAKTGTTGDVVSLGGYVTSRSGERLAFAFLYNGQERWNARETIDAMGATLAGFSR